MDWIRADFPNINWLYKGRIWIGDTEQGIVRAGQDTLISLEISKRNSLPKAVKRFAPQHLDTKETRHGSWILEENAGSKSEDPSKIALALDQSIEWKSSAPKTDSIRNLLKSIKPHVKLDPSKLIGWISKKKIERALSQNVTVSWQYGWCHGALLPRRIRERGIICWRQATEFGRRGEDLAAVITTEDQSMEMLLHVLKAAWVTSPERAVAALNNMGLIEDQSHTTLSLKAHPAISENTLYQILGVKPGLVTHGQARKAIGRAKGMILGGQPVTLHSNPKIRGRADPMFHNRRNRKDTDLFSLYKQGVQLDEEGRYSLTPEKEALAIANRFPKGKVLDAFCGCGGNTIAFARSGIEVTAVECQANRLKMAQHNAKLYGVYKNIKWILGSAFEQRDRQGGIFVDMPWSWTTDKIQETWQWARQWPYGAIKLPKEHPIPKESDLVVLLSSEGYPRAMVVYWGLDP